MALAAAEADHPFVDLCGIDLLPIASHSFRVNTIRLIKLEESVQANEE